MIVSFWKRFLSDILDNIFLGLLGYVLIWVIQLTNIDFGENIAWIGLIIAFLYVGILQSSLGEGQSLAKKILNIQVVRLDGKYLSLPMSFLRYSVLSFIAYHRVSSSIFITLFPNSTWIDTPFLCFVWILFLGCVFMVPIHPQKRGVHDLIAGSIVIKKGTYKPSLKKIKKSECPKLYWAYGSWALASIFVLIIGGIHLAKMSNNPVSVNQDIRKIHEAIMENTHYQNVHVEVNSFTLTVKGFLSNSLMNKPETKDQDVKNVVQDVLTNYHDMYHINKIAIWTRSGINLGIAHTNEIKYDEFGQDGRRLY